MNYRTFSNYVNIWVADALRNIFGLRKPQFEHACSNLYSDDGSVEPGLEHTDSNACSNVGSVEHGSEQWFSYFQWTFAKVFFFIQYSDWFLCGKLHKTSEIFMSVALPLRPVSGFFTSDFSVEIALIQLFPLKVLQQFARIQFFSHWSSHLFFCTSSFFLWYILVEIHPFFVVMFFRFVLYI